ncbi:hypothetical protein THAOC_17077 [Thalassiosira oceanica]|uniref:Uncharacterized protein n=1 Tax=Thalassiosira oceanica TaxID=159749 RepID=K0SAM3_THAOC|nr:hypothetical protein THAOC_17077 [Thalassiosira oceanica]|eukprot:EJK62315.1 hypothetical protein THAOC_17077 [Thalassiosira oceanica]
MFDLHRIGERAMIVEEAVCRKANVDRNGCSESKKETVDEKGTAAGSRIPRPLLRLFEVAHAFALSLQIEILSAQAESLRRGAWGGGVGGSSGGTTECIAVSPAYFFDDPKESTHSEEPLAVMAVHFWSCDDRYGSPSVGDLTKDKPQEDYRDDASSFTRDPNQRVDDNHLPKSDRRGEQRLSLVIRAVPTVGLVVSLSGGADLATERVDESVNSHMNRNLEKLLSSIQDPFQLSMSDALLAATVLCADRRCEAVVSALRRQSKLPSWIHLEVECGTIAIAATVTYPTSSNSEGSGKPTILFRMALDSRTGRFTPTFPRPASILRMLACNDPSASETQALHSAAALQSVTRSNDKRGDATLRDSSGRIVRDAFESLSRSMDTLGRKCGVLGKWNDLNAQSVTLREKSIGLSAQDARASLITCLWSFCCLWGRGHCYEDCWPGLIVWQMRKFTSHVRLSVQNTNLRNSSAGGPIVDESIPNLLRCPPLSVPMHQQLVEKVTKEGDGETKRTSQIQGELFALSAQASERDLSLVCFDVLTLIETASSVPLRLKLARISPPHEVSRINLGTRPKKRVKTETCSHLLETVEDAAFWIDTFRKGREEEQRERTPSERTMSTSSYETRLLARANAPGQKPIWASQHEAIQATLSGNHQTNTDSFTNNGYPLIIPKATPKGAPNKPHEIPHRRDKHARTATEEFDHDSHVKVSARTWYIRPGDQQNHQQSHPLGGKLHDGRHPTCPTFNGQLARLHLPEKDTNLEDLLSAVIRESIAKLRIDDQGMPEDFDLNTALSSLTDADIPFHSLIRHLCAMAMYSNPSANNAMYSVSVENLEDPAFQLLHDRFMGGEIIGFPLEARTIGNNALIGIGQVQKILGPSIPLEGGVGGYSYEIQLERTGEDGERMTVTKKEKDISPLDVSPPSDGDGEDEETPFRDGRNAFPEPSAEDRQAHDVPRRPTCFFLGVRFPH